MARIGRPLLADAARHVLEIQERIANIYPASDSLFDLIVTPGVTADQLEQALANAMSELEQSGHRNDNNLPENATLEDKRLSAASDVTRFSQNLWYLRQLKAATEVQIYLWEASLSTAKQNFTHYAFGQDPIEKYARNFLASLQAAGLTAELSRRIKPHQIEKIKAILDLEVDHSKPEAYPKDEGEIMSGGWRADNPWAEVLKNAENFELTSKNGNHPGIDFNTICEAGLPPSANLEDYCDYPRCRSLLQAFNDAVDVRDKSSSIKKICDVWSQHPSRSYPTNIQKMRQRTWQFLFGIRYSFAQDVPALANVQLRSPWNSDEYIMARKKDS